MKPIVILTLVIRCVAEVPSHSADVKLYVFWCTTPKCEWDSSAAKSHVPLEVYLGDEGVGEILVMNLVPFGGVMVGEKHLYDSVSNRGEEE